MEAFSDIRAVIRLLSAVRNLSGGVMMTELDMAFDDFKRSVVRLKKAFADEHCGNPDHFDIHVNKDNYVTIVCTQDNDCDQVCFKEWIGSDEQ